MNIRQRAETFSLFVGLELKGKITSQRFTAKAVAEGIGRQPAAFNRWLNGKVEMPMTVLCEACEYIDVEPSKIVEDAYARLAVEYGERDGRLYPEVEWGDLTPGGERVIGEPDVPTSVDDVPVMSREEEREMRKSDVGLAAKRGRNEADVDHAE